MKFNRSIWFIIPVTIMFAGMLFSSWYLLNEKNGSSGGIITSGDENENCGGKQDNCGGKNRNSLPGRGLSINLQVPEISVAGNPGAQVTIVEFSDFLCPYCKTEFELLKAVLKKFEGRVRLVFVNYPLDKKCNKYMRTKMHQGACLLAKGAICSSRQNRFSEYMEAAFSRGLKNADMAEMMELAELSQMDIPLFTNCLALPETDTELNKQIESAHKLGISSVPVIFINGKEFSNWKDKDAIVRMIEDELAKRGE